jgi:hypothetical protein
MLYNSFFIKVYNTIKIHLYICLKICKSHVDIAKRNPHIGAIPDVSNIKTRAISVVSMIETGVVSAVSSAISVSGLV